MKIPPLFDKWNPAMRGAYRKGYEAGLSGAAQRGDSPYEDKRNGAGRLTWSRAFHCAWCEGWEAGENDRKDAQITEYYTDKRRTP